MFLRPPRDRATDKFHRLIWPHRDAVLRAAGYLERDEAAAEDLAQETMLKAFSAIQQFQDGTNARAWLLRILRNARVDRMRANTLRLANETINSDVVEAAAAADPLDAAADVELWQDADRLLERFADDEVIDALRGLPDDIRWTLLLVDVEGLDQQEAAQVMDVPVGTVKSRLHRGRAMLRHALTPRARALRWIVGEEATPDREPA